MLKGPFCAKAKRNKVNRNIASVPPIIMEKNGQSNDFDYTVLGFSQFFEKHRLTSIGFSMKCPCLDRHGRTVKAFLVLLDLTKLLPCHSSLYFTVL